MSNFNFNKVSTKDKFNAGVWVPIKIDGELIGAEFKVLNRHSDMGEKLQREGIKAAQREFKRNGNKVVLPDPAESEQDKLDYVVGLVTDWRGPAFEDAEGKIPPFSPGACAAFLMKEKWIIPQLDAAIADESRFLKA